MEIKSISKSTIVIFSILLLVILALCLSIVLIFLSRQQGVDLASILSVETSTPTATLTPASTATPMPTATFTQTPTITPTPEPVNYEFDDVCMDIVLRNTPGIVLFECVTSVTILTDGGMQFNYLWRVEAPKNTGVPIYPDTGNRNMYITDNFGNRIDHIETGGKANETVNFFNGTTEEGWFLFPPPDPNSSYFIFHDADQGIQTEQIQKVWP